MASALRKLIADPLGTNFRREGPMEIIVGVEGGEFLALRVQAGGEGGERKSRTLEAIDHSRVSSTRTFSHSTNTCSSPTGFSALFGQCLQDHCLIDKLLNNPIFK